MVAIAQLVEPRIVIPVVVGSSPISHPISYNFKLHAFSLKLSLGLRQTLKTFQLLMIQVPLAHMHVV